MEHEVLVRFAVIIGLISLGSGVWLYRLAFTGKCTCSCGPGRCDCGCACKPDCACRTRTKFDIETYNPQRDSFY